MTLDVTLNVIVTADSCTVSSFTAPLVTETSMTYTFLDITGGDSSALSDAIPTWDQGICSYIEVLSFDPDLVALSDYNTWLSFDTENRKVSVVTNS